MEQEATCNESTKSRLKQFMNTGNEAALAFQERGIDGDMADSGIPGQPIADLFADCTVMFADIAGFTAWSSAREPVAVFKLLETIYRAFDKTATRRRVFKVETIGDCKFLFISLLGQSPLRFFFHNSNCYPLPTSGLPT